jgi:hypothetical protein
MIKDVHISNSKSASQGDGVPCRDGEFAANIGILGGAVVASESRSCVIGDSVLYRSLLGFAARNSFLGRVPEMVNIGVSR